MTITAEERYMLDVQGYIVLDQVLNKDQIARMQETMTVQGIKDPENSPSKSRFGNFLSWGEEWRNLIDHPRIMPFLHEMLGPKFRLDHAYGMAMRAGGEVIGEGLHHQSAMFNHGCYYLTHNNVMHNGLIVVSWALTDAIPGHGGFICIPGSHKGQFPVPPEWYGLKNNPMVRQVPMKAGDVLIFTEALTHGTQAWTNTKNERRSVLLKYCPLYMQWAKGVMNSDIEGLTPRQKLILEGAYVWERAAVKADEAQPAAK
ncbi:MAG: phytanoyl-CoA dioxygenase family protein [Planctomycetes bacterium]|nr:phytanoyl-CoA dioxygenase family protein [Planctomycetota bacterium]